TRPRRLLFRHCRGCAGVRRTVRRRAGAPERRARGGAGEDRGNSIGTATVSQMRVVPPPPRDDGLRPRSRRQISTAGSGVARPVLAGTFWAVGNLPMSIPLIPRMEWNMSDPYHSDQTRRYGGSSQIGFWSWLAPLLTALGLLIGGIIGYN